MNEQGFLLVTLCLLSLVHAHREPRSLMYPKGATYKFNVGMGFPIDLERILSFSMNFQFQYTLPRNFTEFHELPEIKDRSIRKRLSRSNTYKAMQNIMKEYGLEGRACLLRSICEIAESPIYYNGLIGELLHVIFTPGYASNSQEELEEEYHEARRLGENGTDCRLAFPCCPEGVSPLDLVSLVF